jgi:hypothetical protein
MLVRIRTYLSRPNEQTFAIDFETVVVPLNQVSEAVASEWPLCLLRIGKGDETQRQGERQALEDTSHTVFLSEAIRPDKLREVEKSGHEDIYPSPPASQAKPCYRERYACLTEYSMFLV